MILNTVDITEKFKDLDKVNELALEAFPTEEYLAPSQLIEMAKEDDFDFKVLYDHDAFVGFIAIKKYKTLTYLFFLAIDQALRNKGYGSRAIETLWSLYPHTKQVVDLEKIDNTKDNNQQRIKRKAFYLSNGYQETHHFLNYLGVDYEILCGDSSFDIELFKEMISTLTISGFNPIYDTRL